MGPAFVERHTGPGRVTLAPSHDPLIHEANGHAHDRGGGARPHSRLPGRIKA